MLERKQNWHDKNQHRCANPIDRVREGRPSGNDKSWHFRSAIPPSIVAPPQGKRKALPLPIRSRHDPPSQAPPQGSGGHGRTAGRLGRGNASRLPCWAASPRQSRQFI
ncbi:MAG TPA: hypothetical protein VKY19_22170 [Ktedonosporobacter sp.]|nr:hypothetical protein [Ktedonosporobacter sp.]